MTTVSDAFAAASPAAKLNGKPLTDPDNAGGTRASVTRDAGARARVSVTHRVGKGLTSDVSNAWWWRDVPPSLRDIVGARLPAPGQVPNGSGHLRAVWVLWNFGVAVPATALLYVLAWMLQHPARTGLAALVVGPITLMWINN